MAGPSGNWADGVWGTVGHFPLTLSVKGLQGTEARFQYLAATGQTAGLRRTEQQVPGAAIPLMRLVADGTGRRWRLPLTPAKHTATK